MAINQNDYHYWEGSFQGLLPNEILELSDEDFQILYKEFTEASINLYYLINFIQEKRKLFGENQKYIEGKALKQVFEEFLYDIDSDYFKHSTIKEINLFRSLSVNEVKEINFDDKGICWTYDSNNIHHIERVIVPHNKYLTRFYGTTSIDNIDWIESLLLYINYSTQEKELRVYDSQKVFLKGYVNINYSTMIEYSKGGETSYLLNGVTTKEDILKKRESLLKKFLYNPQTNRYDYDGNLYKKDLSNFVSEDKDGFTINFGKVTGDFECSGLGLTSLKGAPTEVGEGFYCQNNKLTSLEGAPQTVGESFDCSYNQLTSLEGVPQEVGGNFYCDKNQLISLKGAPQKVGGNFGCSFNQLSSLKGAPQEVGGSFDFSHHYLTFLKEAPQKVGGGYDCRNNQLTSLEGAPQKVRGWFYCSNNQLTSLEGAPIKVSESFYCSNNELTSLEGAPQKVGRDFYCKYNKLTSLKGAPKEVGGDFCCENNLNLYSLEGIGEVIGEIIKDF